MATKKVILKRIHIRNFLSFGNNWTIVELDKPGTNLILGENRDIGEEGSRNGVGKSSVMQAISVALFNKPITDIKVGNLVNTTNRKEMEIKLEFITDWDNQSYMVHWGQKPDFVHLYNMVNPETDIALHSKAEVVDQIREIIGIDYLTSKYVLVFAASGQSFLDLSAPKQREVIESLFDMDIISQKAAGASDLKKEFKKELEFQQFKVKSSKENNDRVTKMMVKTEADITDWENDRVNQITALEDALVAIGEINQETLDEEILLVDDIMAINTKIRDIESSIKMQKKIVDDINKEIKKLNVDISHLENDNCPFCKQSMPNAKKSLTSKKKDFKKLNEALATESEKYTKLSDESNELNIVLKELQGKRKYDNLNEIRQLVNEKDNIIAGIEDLKQSKNPHVAHLEELKTNGLQEIDESPVEKAQDDYNHADFLLKLLNNKNSFIRKRIIGQVIPFMNARLSHYIDELGLPHVVRFENDLTVTISQFGRELSFGNLSTGERQRVNLGISFSFRDVLANMHTEFSALFLDEILDSGLDEIGVHLTIKVLNDMVKEKDMSVYLISHRQEVVNMVDNTLHVIKEHGFSRVDDNLK